MKRQKRTVTLKDLASKTGYSINTVSRALRGKDNISEDTISKIKQTAREMGYINNTIASSLRHIYDKVKAVICIAFVLTLLFAAACGRISSVNENKLADPSSQAFPIAQIIPFSQAVSQKDLNNSYLSGIGGLDAGTTVNAEKINTGDIDRYFTSAVIEEGDLIHGRIIGKSYRENVHVALKDLRYLKLLHYNYKHEIQVGELIVHSEIAEDVLNIFKEIYGREYEIESMFLVDNYWPETSGGNGNFDAGVEADAESMRQNNSSGFNYRVVPDSTSLSKHALGYAVDINPLPNPYVVYDKNGNPILQGGGDSSYINRNDKRAHMIDYADSAFCIFSEHGFKWGGDWNSSKDYQHFFYAGGK